MRKHFVILLFITTLIQTFSKVIILTDFMLNRDFIANNLCENKAKPQLHCNGKCQLGKQLKKDEERNNDSKNNSPEIIFYCNQQDFSIPEIVVFNKKPLKYFITNDDVVTNYASGIFHPPNFLV